MCLIPDSWKTSAGLCRLQNGRWPKAWEKKPMSLNVQIPVPCLGLGARRKSPSSRPRHASSQETEHQVPCPRHSQPCLVLASPSRAAFAFGNHLHIKPQPIVTSFQDRGDITRQRSGGSIRHLDGWLSTPFAQPVAGPRALTAPGISPNDCGTDCTSRFSPRNSEAACKDSFLTNHSSGRDCPALQLCKSHPCFHSTLRHNILCCFPTMIHHVGSRQEFAAECGLD